MFRLIGLLGLLSLGACASIEAPSRVASQSPFMPSGIQVDAPQGYIEMCQRQPDLCGASAELAATSDGLAARAEAGDSVATQEGRATLSPANWSPGDAPVAPNPAVFTAPKVMADDAAQPLSFAARMDLLNRVNRFVNDNVRQRTDQATYGVEEYWRPSGIGRGATGDCKDIAIEKRLELIRAGFPDRDLFYAIGYRQDIGLHAVLVARTASGDMVLDSRSPYIVSWSAAPYLWVKHQSRRDPAVWVLVNGPSAEAPDMTVAALDIGAGKGLASDQVQ
jgi:predicted transglutaminase-like cysteine proteinase